MKSAVLLMAHGTPSSLDEMPEYLRLVRGGRPPSAELVAEMRHNYAGDRRTLAADRDHAGAGATRCGRRLGPDVPVAVGMRNWRPFIKDALADLAASGVTRIIGVPMAPQFSTLSVQKYVDAATAALPAGVQLRRRPLVPRASAAARGVRRTRARRRASARTRAVVFTAHSLPVRASSTAATCTPTKSRRPRAAWPRWPASARYEIAYQSAGRTPEPWIGPDLGELHHVAARPRGARRFLVVPVGFVCDHTEILFDIDVQAARTAARDAGATLRRTESLNTSPTFIGALEAIVRRSAMTGQDGRDRQERRDRRMSGLADYPMAHRR